MNIKYTTDGKKVVIIGNLNSQEKIVQEIFITNGQEVPSGENFVVKSLHDAPVVSWQEEDLARKKKNYEAKKTLYEERIEELRKRYENMRGLIEKKT